MANSIKIGGLSFDALKIGSSDVTAAYIGDTLVYSGGTTPPTPPEPSYTYVLMDTNFDTSTPVYGAIMSWVDNEDNDMPFDFFGDQEASEFPYYGSITYDDINDEYTVTIWDYTSTEIYQETFSSEPITLDFIEIVGQPVYFTVPSMYVCLDEDCIEYDEETGDCLEEECIEEADVYFATAKIIQQN